MLLRMSGDLPVMVKEARERVGWDIATANTAVGYRPNIVGECESCVGALKTVWPDRFAEAMDCVAVMALVPKSALKRAAEYDDETELTACGDKVVIKLANGEAYVVDEHTLTTPVWATTQEVYAAVADARDAVDDKYKAIITERYKVRNYSAREGVVEETSTDRLMQHRHVKTKAEERAQRLRERSYKKMRARYEALQAADAAEKQKMQEHIRQRKAAEEEARRDKLRRTLLDVVFVDSSKAAKKKS